MESKATITTIELKRLLITLNEHSPNTKIRFRAIGKMWEENFSQIIQITEQDTLVIQSDKTHQLSFTPINDIVQFEIEDRFQNFDCLNHYTVKFASIQEQPKPKRISKGSRQRGSETKAG